MTSSLRRWRSKPALARLLHHFLAVFGAAWLLLEPLALWRPDNLRWGLAGYLGLISVSLLIAIASAWPRLTISRKMPVSDTRITIKVGNVLEQTGNMVVGVTDVFDTEIGDVISRTSVQGQFQTRFYPNTPDLDALLSRALESIPFKVDSNKTRGKNRRYPLGTVVVAKHGENRFFLTAYSEMSSQLQAQSDICKLTNALQSCWSSIRTNGQHDTVHLPIVGSKYARTGLSRALLLQLLVLSFMDEERRSSITSHLHVYVSPSDVDDVDFVLLDNWLRNLTRSV